MDEPYNKIQLQTELRIDFFIKSISSCAKVDIKITIKHLVLQDFTEILRELELVILLDKEFERRGLVIFREHRSYCMAVSQGLGTTEFTNVIG